MFISDASSSQSVTPPARVPDNSPASPTSFADQVRGTAAKPSTDLDMAFISQDVYKADSTGHIAGTSWSRLSDQQVLAHGIDPEELHNNASGFQAGIYGDGKGDYVLAYAGTQDLKDWKNNISQGFGFDAAQYNQAKVLAKDAKDAFGDNLAITGHSLGGGLAQLGAVETGAPAVTFNAAGLSNETLSRLGMTPDQASREADGGQIRRYDTQWDPLTLAMSAGQPALGNEFRINDRGLNILNAHFMTQVIKGMEQGQITPMSANSLKRPGYNIASTVVGSGFNALTGVVRPTVGLASETVGAAKDMGRGVSRDVVKGQPLSAVGDVAKFGLQTLGNIGNAGLNVAGNMTEVGGDFAGGIIRNAATAVGQRGAGVTAAIWVERQSLRAGQRLDNLGATGQKALDVAGNAVSSGLHVADTAIKGVAITVKHAAATAASTVKDAAVTATDGVVAAGKKGIDVIKSWF